MNEPRNVPPGGVAARHLEVNASLVDHECIIDGEQAMDTVRCRPLRLLGRGPKSARSAEFRPIRRFWFNA
jgi:hypothetical protein